jgi:hypothetical protein
MVTIDKSDLAPNKIIATGKLMTRTAPKGKKRKGKKKGAESSDDSEEEFNIDDCDEQDSDEEEDGDEFNADESKGKLGMIVKLEDLPKDEKYIKCHEKLKVFLEDENCEEEPSQYWHNINGLKTFDNLIRLNMKLICPLCMVSFPTKGSKGRSFFAHLQSHKLKTFKCSCMPHPTGKNF